MNLSDLKKDIAAASDATLADELVDAYEEFKTRYFRRDFRPGQLECGRFAEAAFRILQLNATGSYTPVGKRLPDVPTLTETLANVNASKAHDSIRLHIPKALAAVYHVRNRRDVGHIAADVDANSMDAEYVAAACNWVLAEFVRLFHQCSPQQAQAYVEAIVKRQAPLVQVFGDTPFVLAPNLPDKDEILVLLYHQGEQGASVDELGNWMLSTSAPTIRARVGELERKYRWARRISGRVVITSTGAEYVEAALLPRP